ncbi:hypothetical protein [Butyrivibrio sp.]|uniref:hypothetical protein n=1 Tax=Butyrivibrio sp. TaxID=28121 RepID=UPI0025BF1B6A|nr:hypothetical protein [Butyrivibrio sp.]MBQ9303854.1 hypothetical protein [Butyrivibrio sp.]
MCKPINLGGHAAYQAKMISLLKQYYPDAFTRFGPSLWAVIGKFYSMDLSKIDAIMYDRYSLFGPVPRLPSDMIRSMMVSLVMHKTSYTTWSEELKTNHLAAILSGFHPDDTPGVGTFYDFCDRLWISDKENISNHAHPPKMKKVEKPKNPDDKAEPVEDISVESLIATLESTPLSTDQQPYSMLFRIFDEVFLQRSVRLGLIDLDNLVLSGDGTEVVTSARHRYRKLCKCKDRNCSCNRWYSQPDTDCGYDSSRHKFYYGYDLYMMTAANSDNDLPVFPLLNRASMHDSFGLCYTYHAMKAFLKEANISELLLDSAHDVMAIYQFCQKNSISAIIDLNERNGVNFKYKDTYSIGKDGIPICQAGLKMIRDGYEKSRMRYKFRCANAYHCDGIHCEYKCSDSPYGLVVHVATKDNPRIFTVPARDSKEWKIEYNKRTSSERCNKREKVDYLLENGRHHSTKMWYCRLYCIMMCQHLDAWGKAQSDNPVRDIFAQAA